MLEVLLSNKNSMEENQKMKLRFTTIIHAVRNAWGLHNNEYILADTIYHLSNNPENTKSNWCYAGKKVLAEIVGCTETAIFNMLNNLIYMGLVERDPDTTYLRTTNLWYQGAIQSSTKESLVDLKKLSRLKKVESPTKESLVEPTKESLDNIYNVYKDNDIDNLTASQLDEKKIYSIKENSENIISESIEDSDYAEDVKRPPLTKIERLRAQPEPRIIVKTLSGEENLSILKVFQSTIFPLCNAKTPSIVQGIPCAIEVFKDAFGKDGVSKLIEVLTTFKQSDNYRYLLSKSPAAISPKIILSKKFIQETLIPLSYNQQNNGGVHNSPISEEELRERQAANRERVRKHFSKD